MTRVRLGAALAAVVGLAAAGPAAAQSEGLFRPFRLESFESYLELAYELELQDRESPGSGRASEEDEATIVVGVNLDLAGSLVHPKWFPFKVGGTFRRRSSDVDTTSGRFAGRREEDASEYRVRLGILPENRWSGEAVATRSLQDVDSTFVARRTFLRRHARLSFGRRSRVWPLRFEISRNRAEGLEGDLRDETRQRFLAHLNHLGEHSKTRTELEVQDVVEELTRQDYRLLRLSAHHGYRPQGSRKLLLTSTLYAFDRSGTSEFRNVQGAQSAEYSPRPNLRLSGSVELQDQEDQLGQRTSDRAFADFEHTLWGSLTSRAGARVQRVDLEAGGSQDRDEASLELDYVRHPPRGGALSLRLGGRLRRDDEDLPGERAVASEDRVYEPGVPIFLEPGAVAATVEVTDTQGEPFVEGFDYELRQTGELIEIQVLPEGSIFPGETLRVSYGVEAGRRLDVRTRSWRYGGGWRSDQGWWVRFYTGEQSQDLLAGAANGRIDQTADVEYLAGVERPRWRAGLTYHDRESEILPYVMRQLRGSWRLPLGRRVELTVRGRAQRMSFPLRREETRLELAGADLRYRYRRLRVDATVERWNEDVLGREGRYFQSRVNVRWRHRRIEILAHWRRRNQHVEQGGSQDRDELRIVARRYF